MKAPPAKAALIYSDIIHKSRPDGPQSRLRHPRMPVADRAKIFAPFAALTGFEKIIEAENIKAGAEDETHTSRPARPVRY